MLKVLLRHGASYTREQSEKLLSIARTYSDEELMTLLLQDSGKTPPSFPVWDQDVIRLIMHAGTNGSATLYSLPLDFEDLLFVAVVCGDEKVARLCLESRASENTDGRPAPTYTLLRGQMKRVRQMVASGAEPHVVGPILPRLFRDIFLPSNASIRKAILELEVSDLTLQTSERTPLIFALLQGVAELVLQLLDAGASPNATDSFGSSALHIAAEYNQAFILKLLLKRMETDVNIRNANIQTPLHVAAACGNSVVVGRLLKHPRVQINAQDWSGETALAAAARSGKHLVVRSLLECPNISIMLAKITGRTALDKAKGAGSTEIAAEIEAFIAASGRRGKQKVSSRNLCRVRMQPEYVALKG